MGRFARQINYPAWSTVKTLADAPRSRIKTRFNSNSFALYRRADLLGMGRFSTYTVVLEEVVVAAQLLRQGRSVVYRTEATVFHSHNYSVWTELMRYFDIGVSHQQAQEVLRPFLNTGPAGLAFALAESRFLLKEGYWYQLPEQLVRIGLKFASYRLGRVYPQLPRWICQTLTMHPRFWQNLPRIIQSVVSMYRRIVINPTLPIRFCTHHETVLYHFTCTGRVVCSARPEQLHRYSAWCS